VLVVSHLLHPIYCIWNKLSWNSNAVCRSLRTELGQFLCQNIKQWICCYSTSHLCRSCMDDGVIILANSICRNFYPLYSAPWQKFVMINPSFENYQSSLSMLLHYHFTNWCQQRHVGSKALVQQNLPVTNWGCRLMQVVLYNGHKTVVVIVVVVYYHFTI